MQPTDNRSGTPPEPEDASDIQVLTEGAAAQRNVDYALRRLRPVVASIDEPILYTLVRLSVSPNPAQPRPARAQVVVDIHGDLVRAHVAGETMAGAIDMLKDRLRDQLKHRRERREARRRRPPTSQHGTWRRGDLPRRRPVHFYRPVGERGVIRRKTYSIGETSPEQAIEDMQQLDHDFFLFREAARGEDALVVRQSEGTYRLLRLRPAPPEVGYPAAGIEVADVVPPRLSTEQAVEQLGVTGERFLFFENDRTERGNVLYLRYDGHYGLITPG